MRKILFLSYVVWLLVALTGCNHEADALLERAEGFQHNRIAQSFA